MQSICRKAGIASTGAIVMTGAFVAAIGLATDARYQAIEAGKLHFNVHSNANKGGEIRGQLKP